jgi:hypothetical protein
MLTFTGLGMLPRGASPTSPQGPTPPTQRTQAFMPMMAVGSGPVTAGPLRTGTVSSGSTGTVIGPQSGFTTSGAISSPDPNVTNTYRHLQWLLNHAAQMLYGAVQGSTYVTPITGVIDSSTATAAVAIAGVNPPCASDLSCGTMSGDIQVAVSCCSQPAWLAANAQQMIVWLETYLSLPDNAGASEWYIPPTITCPDGSQVPVGTSCPQPTTTTTAPGGGVVCADGSTASDPSLCPTGAQPAPGSSPGMTVTPTDQPPLTPPSPVAPDGGIVMPTIFGFDQQTVIYGAIAVVAAATLGFLLFRPRRSTTAPAAV